MTCQWSPPSRYRTDMPDAVLNSGHKESETWPVYQ